MNRAGLYIAAAALLAGILWIKFIHDPAVRTAERLEAASHVTDSMTAVVAQRRSKDSVAGIAFRDSLTRSAALRVALAQRGGASRARTDTLWRDLPPIEDSTLARKLLEIRQGDSVTFAVKDSTIGSLEIDLASANVHLGQKDSIIHAVTAVGIRLVGERDAFAKEAGKKWHLIAGAGLAVNQNGAGPGVFLGFGRSF